MGGREFHPVAELFPLLDGKPFEELVADIRQNGLHEPILLDAEGRILDGRNRYLACRKAGVEPRYVEWQGQGSPVDLALSLNLRRRHLNESQRAMVAARLAKMLEPEAMKRSGRPSKSVADMPGFSPERSRDTAAAMVNVSPRLSGYAIKILRDGCEGLIRAVDSGTLPATAASRLAGLPRDEQAQLAAAGLEALARKAKELRSAKSEAAPPPSGRFGLLRIEGPEHADHSQKIQLVAAEQATEDTVVFLWVDLTALPVALEGLAAVGLSYTDDPEPDPLKTLPLPPTARCEGYRR